MKYKFKIDMEIKYQSYESLTDFFKFLQALCDEGVIDSFSHEGVNNDEYIIDSYHIRHYEIWFSLKDDCMNVALFKFIERLQTLRMNLISSNNVAYILLMLLLNSASNSNGSAEVSFKSTFTDGKASLSKCIVREDDMFYYPHIIIRSTQSVIERVERFLQDSVKYRPPKIAYNIEDSNDGLYTSITIYPGQFCDSKSYSIYFISEFLKDLKNIENSIYWNRTYDSMIKSFNHENGELNYHDSIIDITSYISYGAKPNFKYR